MKTTRRDFLKGLFATGATLAVAPHLLVELVHGASDLTPQERDVAAEVMGLRQKQWRGAELWYPKTMRRTTWADGVRMTDRIDDWDFKHGNLVVFLDAKTELLIDGEWVSVGETSAPEEGVCTGRRWPSPGLGEWERELLYGVPGGEMPTGVIYSGQTIHVKFTEEETVWKRRSIIVPVPESPSWSDGSPRFGQMEVPLLANGEPDWDYVTRAMRELEEQAGDKVSVRWGAEDDPLFFFDRGLYEHGT